MKPRSAPCGLWSLCTDEECRECPQAAAIEPSEPCREPERVRIPRTTQPVVAFSLVNGPARSAFYGRRR